jgi:catechol 2,3-dioxygenase-like lactoylglutathione lyase family enzyme
MAHHGGMTVKRVVPDLATQGMEASRRFYADLLGLVPVMDLGWIVTLAARDGGGRDDDQVSRAGQVSLMTHDATAPVVPAMSVEVDDVDAAYAAAVETGAEIVHPLTDEPWGVRRFFVRDPAGHVVNVLAHR